VSVLAVWALVGGESPPQLDSTSLPGAPPIAAREAARAPEPVTPPAPAPEEAEAQPDVQATPVDASPLVDHAEEEEQAPDPSPVSFLPAAEEELPAIPEIVAVVTDAPSAEPVEEPATEELLPTVPAVETIRPAPEAVEPPDLGVLPIVEPAFLDVRIKTTVASGSLTAWVDDEQVYSLELTAPEGEKGIRKLQFWKRGETITAWIEIPSGSHELRVELIDDGGSGNRSQQFQALELQPGEVRKLKIVAGKEGTPLSLRAD